MSNNNWYPNRSDFQTHEQWDAHVQTLNKVYEVLAQAKALHERVTQAESAIMANTSNIGRNMTGTNLQGIIVKASVPLNGQKLTYNATTGQAEWI